MSTRKSVSKSPSKAPPPLPLAPPPPAEAKAPARTKKPKVLTRGQQKAVIHTFSDVEPVLREYLYDKKNVQVDLLFIRMEEAAPQVKREQAFYGICGLIAVYLIFGSLAQFVCNLIGFAYPAYASVKAIRTEDKEDDTHWLIYWTVFGVFSLFDGIGDAIMQTLPIYWLAKAIFLVCLYLPQTYGAQVLYEKLIDPAITNMEMSMMADVEEQPPANQP